MKVELNAADRDITWGDLRHALLVADPEDPILRQPIQVLRVNSGTEEIRPLLSAVAIGALRDLLDPSEITRSSVDNHHRPESLVLLVDSNPFGLDGAVAESLLTGERLKPQGVKNWLA